MDFQLIHHGLICIEILAFALIFMLTYRTGNKILSTYILLAGCLFKLYLLGDTLHDELLLSQDPTSYNLYRLSDLVIAASVMIYGFKTNLFDLN